MVTSTLFETDLEEVGGNENEENEATGITAGVNWTYE
jgi:hypothetical protein